MCITLREYEAIVSKRTVQNCRRADDSLIAIYSSVHYFLHLTFANAAGGRGGGGERGGLYMARHHMAGTADRPTRMLISRCPRFLRDAFLSTVRIRSAAEYHASFETKRREKERERQRRREIQKDCSQSRASG